MRTREQKKKDTAQFFDDIKEKKAAAQKEKNRQAVRNNREKKRQLVAPFRPRHTEGRVALESLNAGKSKDVVLNDEDVDRVVELCRLLTEKDLLEKYSSWGLRAVALGITSRQLFTLRQTRTYHRVLIETIRNGALEGTAEALPAQSRHAKSPMLPGSQTAFSKLAEIGGASGGLKSLTLNQTNNFEGELRKLAEGAIIDVPAEPTED